MTPLLKGHLLNVSFVTLGYIIAMMLVQVVIVPVQQLYLPAITTFAALIFPLHGVRVLAAWLFGGWSIIYLFVANCIMHLVLTPTAEFNLNSLFAWFLVSSVAWLTFEAFRVSGFNFYEKHTPISGATWRHLMIIAFASSIFNSIGHNIIFVREILPENSVQTILAFLIGDTLGTFLCFIILMTALRILRRLHN